MRFGQLPLRLRCLIAAKSVASVAVMVWFWTRALPADPSMLVLLTLFGAATGIWKVDAQVRAARITVSFTVSYFALLLLGPAAALLVALVGVLGGCLVSYDDDRRIRLGRTPLYRLVYNLANVVVSIAATAWAYQLLGGTYQRIDIYSDAVPIIASALAYYFVNHAGVSLAVAWSQDLSWTAVFRKHFAWAWPGFLTSATISALVMLAYQALHFRAAALLLFGPICLVYYYYAVHSQKIGGEIRHMQEVNRLNESVIASLAVAIDAKDHHTGQHVDRVREYALGVARKLDVGEAEQQAIRIASILHDIGKIGIPERILCKPGKLTTEEFEVMKTHVEIGAQILEQVEFPWPVVPVVRSHHERWDGLGYPAGLKGEEIPIGGRIISMVDVFDALTSDRPYRKAMPREQAIQVIRASSGTQFDPSVVETFIQILPELDTAIEALRAAAPPEAPGKAAILARADETAEDHDRAEELLGAITSLASAGSMVDVLPVIEQRLQEIVPFASFAVFVADAPRRHVRAVCSAGLWSELFEDLEVRIGEGVSGYVAETGQVQVNAAAPLDLARRVRPGENLELNSTLSVPLILDGAIIGTVTAYHAGYTFYRGYHLERLQRVAKALAGCSLTPDPLSEPALLPAISEAALLDRLRIQVAQAQRQQQEVSLLLLAPELPSSDAAAARAVETITTAVRETVRDRDGVCALPDGRFAVVLPRCGQRDVAHILCRLRERLRWERLNDPDAASVRIGIAAYPADGQDPEALIQAAQAQLRPEPADDRILR